jgi:single-strand DNA-binding protein
MSINKAILVGHVGKDPEIRTMQSGDKIASFSLATSERWTDKRSGEKQEKTEWHNIVVFGERLVGVVEAMIAKGTKLYIEGKIETRSWTDNQQNKRYTTEIKLSAFEGKIDVLAGYKERGDAADAGDRASYGSKGEGQSRGGGSKKSISDDLDDEIPF